MEELFELRAAIEQQRYNDALVLLGEMEEMSREDKLHKIRSYVIVPTFRIHFRDKSLDTALLNHR
jgi:hypothetical protein